MIFKREANGQDHGDALLASQEGIDAYLANLYRQIPIEDFNTTPEALNAFSS